MIFAFQVKMQRLVLRNVIFWLEFSKLADAEMLRNRLNRHGCSVDFSLI